MDTRNESRQAESTQREPDEIEFDRYASYEEDGSLVICDRKNPNAWIKSNVSGDLVH